MVGGGSLRSPLIIGSTIDGTRDSLVLCVTPLGGVGSNSDVQGSITWRELL